MDKVSMIGIDLAKNSFQLHGAWADGSVAFRKKLSRGKVLEFLASQPGCAVAMEACASAHYWGREIVDLGACRIYPGGAGIAIARLRRSRRPGSASSSFGQFCPGSHCTINI